MEATQLLKEYPKTAVVVKQWFLEKMLDSMKTESLPEDFKDYVRQQGIDDDKVAYFIDSTPRSMFDVLDNHKVFVEIFMKNSSFYWKIGEESSQVPFESRKNAESSAIESAFKILNEKL